MNTHELLKALHTKIKKYEIHEIKKEALIKIINLTEDILEKSLGDVWLEAINNKKLDKIDKEVINVKINSIMSDLTTKYEKKTNTASYCLYFYSSHIDIYLKPNFKIKDFSKIKEKTSTYGIDTWGSSLKNKKLTEFQTFESYEKIKLWLTPFENDKLEIKLRFNLKKLTV